MTLLKVPYDQLAEEEKNEYGFIDGYAQYSGKTPYQVMSVLLKPHCRMAVKDKNSRGGISPLERTSSSAHGVCFA